MPKIIPITDLRNTTKISELCHEKNEPVFITKNGYSDLVIMSAEAYDRKTRGDVLSDGAKPYVGGDAG